LSLSSNTKCSGRYILIVSQFTPNYNCKYWLNVQSTKPVTLKEIKEQAPTTNAFGEWTSTNCGGCMNYPGWRRNPQFIVTANRNCNSTITLEQLPRNADLMSIGFYIFNTKNSKRIFSEETLDIKSEFINSKSISIQRTLREGESFIIMPTTFNPYPDSTSLPYKIFIKTSDNSLSTQIQSLDINYNTKQIFGEWNNNTAGGCTNHPSWKINPQYVLTIQNTNITDNQFSLILELPQKNDEAIGLYIYPVTTGNKPTISSDKPLFKSEFIRRSTFLTTDLTHGSYIILPCTYNPNIRSEYRLTVYTSHQFTITKL